MKNRKLFLRRQGKNSSSGVSELGTHQGGDPASNTAATWISELEQILKHKFFTRSEAQRLKALVDSRTMEESPSPLLRVEASTASDSLKKHNHGDESHNFHAAVFPSRVVEEENAELVNVYKGSNIGTALRQHPATIESLPEELLSNILVRLLAKQLSQMRSVSKSWNALLCQPSFIRSHLNRSIRNNDQLLLTFYKRHYHIESFTTHSCRYPHLQLTNFIKLPVNPQPEYTKFIRVIGSVNGLICSSYSDDSVIQIWNPSLSALLTLPPYSMPYNFDLETIEIYFGFGFDPKTDDYKVIKITGYNRPHKVNIIWWLQVEIYSMRKGSWKFIFERFPSHITKIIDNDNFVCVDGRDGHLHWLGCIGEKRYPETIVVFNLGSETFHEIALPDSTLSFKHDCFNFNLGVLGGKLYVMSWDEYEHVGCEVWVMEEYGVVKSWVKRHVFSQFVGDNTNPFGFTSHSGFLVHQNGHLVLYDPVADKETVLENHGPEGHGVHKIVEYVDSLVWVAPDMQEKIEM